MSVYRLAICEDDPRMLAFLRQLCEEILAETEHELALFPSAAALDAELSTQAEPFHLLLLDIQMEGMTGMELAQALRRRGDEVSIIFITSSQDYLLEGYEIRPIHYLLKPVTKEALEKAIRTDWTLRHAHRRVLFRNGGKTVALPLADIRYVEGQNHSAIVHLPGETLCLPMFLAQAERLLPADQFARCHNSFLVNLAQVKLVGRTELNLRDGTVLPVGRRFYEAFQTTFVQYINR